MTTKNTIIASISSGKDWAKVLRSIEISQLEREREHLVAKALERPLTAWEQEQFARACSRLENYYTQAEHQNYTSRSERFHPAPTIMPLCA